MTFYNSISFRYVSFQCTELYRMTLFTDTAKILMAPSFSVIYCSIFSESAKTMDKLQARAVSYMLFDDRNDDNTPGLFSRVRISHHIQYTLFFLFSTL